MFACRILSPALPVMTKGRHQCQPTQGCLLDPSTAHMNNHMLLQAQLLVCTLFAMECAVSTAHPLMCHTVSVSVCSIRVDIQGGVSALCLSACHLINQDSGPTMVSKPPMCRYSPPAIVEWHCKNPKQHQAILCLDVIQATQVDARF